MSPVTAAVVAATAVVAASDTGAASENGPAREVLGGGFRIRAHVAGDYRALRALWDSETSPVALGLSRADEPAGVAAFLERNPGLSLGLWRGKSLVGSILAGSDGRRGYIYHLVVRHDMRRAGWGRMLVETALGALAAADIHKAHAFVYAANESGRRFWESLGFALRQELVVYSRQIEGLPGRPGTPAV